MFENIYYFIALQTKSRLFFRQRHRRVNHDGHNRSGTHNNLILQPPISPHSPLSLFSSPFSLFFFLFHTHTMSILFSLLSLLCLFSVIHFLSFSFSVSLLSLPVQCVFLIIIIFPSLSLLQLSLSYLQCVWQTTN